MKGKILLAVLLGMAATAFAQKVTPRLLAGPRLGYVTFMEARIWAMTTPGAVCELQYYEITKPKRIFTATQKIKNKEQGICEFICEIEPGKKYNYDLYLNHKRAAGDSLCHFQSPALWRWRTPPPNFSIAFGSCNYLNERIYDRPGKPYGDTDTRIFNNIAAKNPNLFFWLGDNIYLREPDWGSETGIYHRYKQFVQDTALNKLFKRCPNYAIWDDHDFGPNDANGSFANKNLTLKAFNEFWENPPLVFSEGCNASWFEYNDAQCFLLDNRFSRVADSADASYSILGRRQVDWLKQALIFAPKNDFKIICIGGQFLSSAAVFENYANWKKERQEILDWIDKNKIKNVIFLTGDRHFAELSLLTTPSGVSVYDFTASPLTSSNHSPSKNEINSNRVEGTLYDKNRNFGMIQFSSVEGGKRKAEFVLFDKNGTEIWRKAFIAE